MAAPAPTIEPDDGAALARLAAEVVSATLAGHPVPGSVPDRTALLAVGASFVTLEAAGRLRGCIGTVEASRPLYLDVIRNTERAMRDPRLPAVQAAERDLLDVKVSVLAPGRDVPAGSPAELISALRPGVDGVLLTDGRRRATFLPAVWAKLPDPEAFVAGLLTKGGWRPAPDGWPDGLTASTYTSTEYRSSVRDLSRIDS